MNVHIISGRLTRDPEVRFSQTGKTVTSFTVAVRRDYKNQAGEYESAEIIKIKLENMKATFSMLNVLEKQQS